MLSPPEHCLFLEVCLILIKGHMNYRHGGEHSGDRRERNNLALKKDKHNHKINPNTRCLVNGVDGTDFIQEDASCLEIPETLPYDLHIGRGSPLAYSTTRYLSLKSIGPSIQRFFIARSYSGPIGRR